MKKLTLLSILLVSIFITACNSGETLANPSNSNGNLSASAKMLATTTTIEVTKDEINHINSLLANVESVSKVKYACGMFAINQFMFDKYAVALPTPDKQATKILKWLTLGTESNVLDRLDSIKSFTHSFQKFDEFSIFDITISKNTFRARFAMSPFDVQEYLSKIENKEITFNIINQPLTAAALDNHKGKILGLSTLTDIKEYNGLSHWIYIDSKGTVWSNGSSFQINDFMNSKYCYYESIIYTIGSAIHGE